MNLLLQKILLVFVFFLCMIWTNAQINISQEISPQQINKNEYATLKIVIENYNTIQHVTPPSLKDFIILSGPNQESGMSAVNGNVKRYSALTFILKPRRPGKLKIDAATVNIEGKLYKTNVTTLQVNNETSATGSGHQVISPILSSNFNPFAEEKTSADFSDYVLHKGENINDKVNRNMQLRLETDKTSCYVGEPVVATYKLYTRLKSESKLTENPAFNGFSVIDLTNAQMPGFSKNKLNGREYNVYTIRKAQLYPLLPGNIDLETAELENSIQFVKEDYVNKLNNNSYGLLDEFADATMSAAGIINQTVSLKSKPVTILVKPLPETNKPNSFTGAVGDFTMDAQIQKNNFPANESGKLIIRISGYGNLQLITSPMPDWPVGINPFDPKVSEELDKTSVPVRGNKTFEYSFSVNGTGKYVLPPVIFSYFNPRTATYKTIESKEIIFNVSNAVASPVMASVTVGNKPASSGINKIFNNRWWIIEFMAAVMMIGLIFWIRKNKRTAAVAADTGYVMSEEEIKLNEMIAISALNQQNPLEKTEECLFRDNCIEFYSLLNKELKDYLSRKFLIDHTDVNTKSMAAIMDKKNISNQTALQLQHLLEEIEWQLYTPFERNEKMNELYHSALDIIQQINDMEFRHQ